MAITYNRTRLEAKKNVSGDIISFIFGITAIDDVDNESTYIDTEISVSTPKPANSFTQSEIDGLYNTWLTDNNVKTDLDAGILAKQQADKVDDTFDFNTLPA